MFAILIFALGLLGQPAYSPTRLPAAPPIRIVTSLTTYGAIAREIVGDKGTVTSIAQGDEDPHFVQPKPSFVRLLRDADLFVTTGLDLELWVPALLDRAGNRKIAEGAPGYVTAYKGIHLLEVPTSLEPLPGRHPRGRQPAHPHRPGERHHHRPQHPRRAPAGLARQRGVLHRRGRRTSRSGCSRPPWARPGDDAHAGHRLRAAQEQQAPRLLWRRRSTRGSR